MTIAYPKLILGAEFHDMSQYGEAVGWDLDFRQLEIGKLDARVKVIAVNFGMILNVDFNRSFHQMGCAPDDQLTFGIPDLALDDFDWCSAEASGGSLLNFNLEGGFEGVSPAGFSGHTFTFNTNALQTFADKLGLDEDLDSLVRHHSHWRSEVTISLGQRLRSLTQHLETQALRENAEMLNEEIAITVLDLLSTASTRVDIADTSKRHSVLRKSLEILDDIEHLPITVGQLCAKVGTSLSTLRRVFMDEFGVPPKVYIRIRCLSAVRDELASSPFGTTVADIANCWGFWHMGQFAADYREMFGELPSRALKRNW